MQPGDVLTCELERLDERQFRCRRCGRSWRLAPSARIAQWPPLCQDPAVPENLAAAISTVADVESRKDACLACPDCVRCGVGFYCGLDRINPATGLDCEPYALAQQTRRILETAGRCPGNRWLAS